MSTQSSLLYTDPDTLWSGSITLEGEVHKDAMPSGQFNPIPVPKPKGEEAELIPLTPELYPSAPNGVSVNVVFAGVQGRVKRLVGDAALLLKSVLGSSGGGTIRVVSRSGTPVPGSSAAGAAAGGSFDVRFQEGQAGRACGGSSCGVEEAEVRAMLERALGDLPTPTPWSGESVGAAVDARAVLEIVAGLASPGGDSDCEEYLKGAVDGGKSDTVLITVCNCLEVDDCTGYIEMRTVAADGGRDEQQDYEVSHAGGGF